MCFNIRNRPPENTCILTSWTPSANQITLRETCILTIVDVFSWLSPAMGVRPHYRGTDVVETLGFP